LGDIFLKSSYEQATVAPEKSSRQSVQNSDEQSRYSYLWVHNTGCQMVSLQTKNHCLGIFWRTSELKMLLYILVIGNILVPLGIFYGHFVIL
jgi:phosphate-selective porin